MKQRRILLGLAITVLGCDAGLEGPDPAAHASESAIDDQNRPERLGFPIDRRFTLGTAIGTIHEAGWTPFPGSWWPYWNDGINNRWQGGDSLSPAELYDAAFQGWNPDAAFMSLDPMSEPGDDFDVAYYSALGPAAGWEHRQSGNADASNGIDDDGDGQIDERDDANRYDGLESWFGHCNGWASAAINEREPRRPVTFAGRTFQVADIKALLAEVYFGDKSTFSGIRCNARPASLRTDATGRALEAWMERGTGGPLLDASGTVKKQASKTYQVTVAGPSKLVIKLAGNGDADLYVRKGAAPTLSTYDCRPYKNGSAEECSFENASGTYHIMVRGYASSSTFTIKGEQAGKLIEVTDYTGPFWADGGETHIVYRGVTYEDEGPRVGTLTLPYSHYKDFARESWTGVLEADGRLTTVQFAFSRGCRDINPGTLYLAATQILGRYQQPFVIDTAADYQVWSFPVYRYRIAEQRELTKTQANTMLGLPANGPYRYNPSATRFAYVELDLWFVAGSPAPSTSPQLDQVSQYTTRQRYTFVLELDDAADILGGEYTGESRTVHPDFIWVPYCNSSACANVAGTSLDLDDDTADTGNDNPHLRYSHVKRLAMQSALKDGESFTEAAGQARTLPTGATSAATAEVTATGTIREVAVRLRARDLQATRAKLWLVHPDGTEVPLYDRGSSGWTIDGVARSRPWVDGTGNVQTGLGALAGKPAVGTWSLRVENQGTYDADLAEWAIWIICDDGNLTQPQVIRHSGTVAALEEDRFQVQLPPDAYDVVVRIDGTGDADLYTGIGTSPSVATYACRPYKWGTNESCAHNEVEGKMLHVMVRGWADRSDYELTISYKLRGDGTGQDLP